MTTHGMHGTPEYNAWLSMRKRCYKKYQGNYKNYGGRGITVCKRWLNSFENFFKDLGRRPSKAHSLDRINNEGNYTPKNCRWADSETQGLNTRSNRLLSFKGQKKPVSRWARDLGMNPTTLFERLRRGWSVKKALTTPLQTRKI